MEKKSYRKILIATSVVLIIALICSVVAVSLAFWRDIRDTSDTNELQNGDWDASSVSQVFQMLDIDGNIITPKSLTGINPETEEEEEYALTDLLSSFALVGYTGMEEKLVILSEYSIEIDGVKVTKPVTKIMSPDNEATFYRNNVVFDSQTSFVGFTNNQIVSEIIIPETVTEITASVFAFMPKLKRVEFKGDDDLLIGDYTFRGCAGVSFISSRNIIWGKM